MSNICPSCERGLLKPIIKSKPIMIVKEVVTQNELDNELVFTLNGKNKYGNPENTTSYYLQRELGMVGVQMSALCLTNLHLHVPPKRKKTKEEKEIVEKCNDFSISEFIKLAKGMKVILMMGAETIKFFTGYNASEVYGLVCQSTYLPEVPVIIPCPNSDKLMSQPIGELRNALKVFSDNIKAWEQYSKI